MLDCDNIKMLPPLYWQQEGGETVDYIVSLVLTVVAGVITYYICKWLDGET